MSQFLGFSWQLGYRILQCHKYRRKMPGCHGSVQAAWRENHDWSSLGHH